MNQLTIRIVAALAVLTLGVTACGSSDHTAQKLQQQGASLQAEGAAMQTFMSKEKADVAARRKTQEQADAEIQTKSNQLQKDALKTSSAMVGTAANDSRVPDSAKQQLSAAQSQLDAAAAQQGQ